MSIGTSRPYIHMGFNKYNTKSKYPTVNNIAIIQKKKKKLKEKKT